MSRRPANPDPIARLLDRQRVVILDGSLGAELTSRGHDLDDELWSARLLIDDPGALSSLHRTYLEAGADCLTTASYQATLEGFQRRGRSLGEAEDLLRLSVSLAARARDDFWNGPSRRRRRRRPLVAASVGPYGAYLADGSEFTGDYGLDADGLTAFHRRRLEILSEAGADLLAIETVPSLPETRALAGLLRITPGPVAWVSFSCRDDRRLRDGSDLAAAVAELEGVGRVVAVGVNCTAPRCVPGLIAVLAKTSRRPIVAYPNSGEAYDARAKRWIEPGSPVELDAEAVAWHAAGARLIGGCCRVGPRQIRRIRERLLGPLPVRP